MFIDYYEVLDVAEDVSFSEIKKAYKKQVLKWHPDRNSDPNATSRMQLINEAYLILRDENSRRLYDIEYQQLKKIKASQSVEINSNHTTVGNNRYQKEYVYEDYNIKDDVIKNKMQEAHQKSVTLAKQSLEDLLGMLKVGAKEGVKAALQSLGCFLIIQLLFIFFYLLVKIFQ